MSSPRLFARSLGSTVDAAGRIQIVKASTNLDELYEALATPHMQLSVITAIDRRLRHLLNTTHRPSIGSNAPVKCGKRACGHLHNQNERTGHDALGRSLCPKCGIEPTFWFATPLDVLVAMGAK